MDTNLTKRSAKKLIGVKTDAGLARFLKITKQAVNKWGEDDPIPRLRGFEIKEAMRQRKSKAA